MYEITAKRNVQLLSVGGKTLMSGESTTWEIETEEMKKAKRIGLIDYVEAKPKSASKPTIPVGNGKPALPNEEAKLREMAAGLGIKEASTASPAALKALIQHAVDKQKVS